MLTELSAPLESSLPRTSWGGLPPAPNPPLHRTLRKSCRESVPDLAKVLRLLRNLSLTFLTPLICRKLTVINAPFAESSLLRSSSPLLNHHSFEHHGGGCPPPTPLLICRMLTELSAPLVESSLPRTSWGGCRPPNPPADLMLRLRQTLHRTLRKYCACRKIRTSCESAAPAAKSGPHLAKVLHLPRIRT